MEYLKVMKPKEEMAMEKRMDWDILYVVVLDLEPFNMVNRFGLKCMH